MSHPRRDKQKPWYSKSVWPAASAALLLLCFLALILVGGRGGTAIASDLGLTEADCRCCHDTGVPDRHHLLVETQNQVCLNCHEMIWDEPSSSWVPIVTRDCLVCHVGTLADRHHIVNNDCFACHEAIWDPVSQSFFISFANGCAPKATIENCSDGIDNDGNGLIDCNDPYCAGTTSCLPSTAEICSDGIDNNGDNQTDCFDSACVSSPLCLPLAPEDCNDAIDNDANGLTDCADPACLADLACVSPPVELCSDGIDNDGDQWVDCSDPDCYGDTNCLVSSAEICTDSIDNDGNGLIDCQDPDCVGTVDCPDPSPTPVSHFDLHQSPSNDCSACHLTNLHDQHNKNCNYCHQNPDPAIQATVAAGSTDCTACHSATTHTMGCANCHKQPKNYQLDTVHTRHMDRVACGVCHEIPVTVNLEPTGQYCLTCHGVARPYTHAEVPDLHRLHVTGRGNFPYSCNMCHGQNIPQIRPEECSACHSDNRLYNPADLPAIHTTHSRIFDCTNCHFDPRLFALDDQATVCLRCHEMRPYTTTLDLHALHTGQSCWTCHTSNGVTARAGHSCASCHNGTTPAYNRLSTDVHKRHAVGAAPCWTCHSQLVPVFPTLQLSTASPSGAISGAVTGPQGAAVEHVTVDMADCGHSSLTTADGAYTLNFISPGSYTLTASKAGYQAASQAVEVSIGYTSTADFALTPLPNTGSVSGVIVDDQGLPVPGAQVATADMQYAATAAADGSFLITPIVEGSYQLTATLYGYVEQTTTVTVVSGQSSSTGFTLVQYGPELCFDGFDNDGDGQTDCADNDCGPECNSLEEICGDGIDNDQDGAIDCFDSNCSNVCNRCTDNDGDGYYIDGDVCGAIDCNDADPLVHPGAAEACDTIDNNCDGQVDEGLTTRYYLDSDRDNFGELSMPIDACNQPTGYVLDSTDCNDVSAAAYPGGVETCDSLDNNCDGQVDEGLTTTYYLDGDADGYGKAISNIEACSQPVGYVTDFSDCNDGNALVNPGASETCNGVDDNCSGQIDEGVTSTFYLDADADGFGDAASSTQACSAPAGYVADASDCNDAASAINPAAAEICSDSFDNDCNGQTDYLDPACSCSDFNDESSCIADPSCAWTVNKQGRGSCKDAGGTTNQEICDDGIDNDGDGAVDCDDNQCNTDPACGTTNQEVCTDGIDNDGDGAVDCDDNQCNTDPACQSTADPEICTDGIDNDGDGRIDCDDNDCNQDPACSSGGGGKDK